jgi:predicted nucleic acid-binding protein
VIVMDASAVVEALARKGEARERLTAEPVAVPHLVDAEVAHALRRQVMRGALPADEAGRRLHLWTRLTVRRQEAVALIPRIWQLREVLSAYDATYVAMAEAFGCPLVTCDERLARAPGTGCAIDVVGRS